MFYETTMANDDDMRRLMEHLLPTLYFNFASNTVNIATPDSFVPRGYITNEFFVNMCTVLIKKKVLILKRWKNYFAISCLKALESHEMYVRYLMFACEVEIELSKNVFDSLLSVCVLMITFITETLENTGVNFGDLTVDCFMEFYETTLNEPFNWYGGFEQLAIYLRNENFTGEDFNGNSVNPITYRFRIQKLPSNKIEKVFEKIRLQPEYITHVDVIRNLDCHILAINVLVATKIKLPTLPSSNELMARIRASRQKQAADSKRKTLGSNSNRNTRKNSKTEEVLLTSKIKLCDVPNVTASDNQLETMGRDFEFHTMEDSKRDPTEEDSTCRRKKALFRRFSKIPASDAFQQKANICCLKNVVQQVIKYNYSKCSHPSDSSQQIEEEVDEIISHLKNTIKSLIDVLDKCTEENNF